MLQSRVRELYVAALSDTYESEEEILRQLPLMAARAGDPALREMFEDHYRDTQRHVTRLARIFDRLDERRRPGPARALVALIDEARRYQSLVERGDALDLTLIDAGRRIEHYEIAAYSTMVGYAQRLAQSEDAALLRETLEEEHRAESRLEMLTSSSGVTA